MGEERNPHIHMTEYAGLAITLAVCYSALALTSGVQVARIVYALLLLLNIYRYYSSRGHSLALALDLPLSII